MYLQFGYFDQQMFFRHFCAANTNTDYSWVGLMKSISHQLICTTKFIMSSLCERLYCAINRNWLMRMYWYLHEEQLEIQSTKSKGSTNFSDRWHVYTSVTLTFRTPVPCSMFLFVKKVQKSGRNNFHCC